MPDPLQHGDPIGAADPLMNRFDGKNELGPAVKKARNVEGLPFSNSHFAADHFKPAVCEQPDGLRV